MTTEALSTPTEALSTLTAAPPSTTLIGDIPISIGISNATDPDFVSLVIPPDKRYLAIPEGFNGTITWNLDGENSANAFFDNPPITVNGECLMPELSKQSSKSISMNWANDAQVTRGMSFFYTLRVFVVIDDVKFPIRHDPTVHNDPPTG